MYIILFIYYNVFDYLNIKIDFFNFIRCITLLQFYQIHYFRKVDVKS